MRKYELVFIAEPRLSDEEVVTLTKEYREMIEGNGGTVTREESWGKRRLAYPIQDFNEGRYVLFGIETDGNPFPEIEQRMRQNEKVLRYLTVRMDAGRLRERPPRAGAEPAAETAKEAGNA